MKNRYYIAALVFSSLLIASIYAVVHDDRPVARGIGGSPISNQGGPRYTGSNMVKVDGSAATIGLDGSGCGTGQVPVYGGSAWSCGVGGVSNSAGVNVIPVSTGSGSGFGSSGETDDGTTFSSTRNTFVTGTLTGSGAVTYKSTVTVWGNWTGSGNVTLGDAAADAIAFNGSASTTLDMNSHKILDVTNGTAAQDAAAFGQIASGVNTAVSGTSGRIPKFTGTNTIGNSAGSDDGTTFSIGGTSIFAITEANGNTAIGGTLTTTGAVTNKSTETVWGNWVGSGNVTLGDATADQIAFNGSASTLLNMNTHTITAVVDPSNPQDAATKHYVDSVAIVGAVAGTTNRMVKFTAANAVGDALGTINLGSAATDTLTVAATATFNAPLTAAGNFVSTAGTTTTGNTRGTNITPTLTGGATVNDWAPTGNGTAAHIFVNCPSTVCTITGLVGGADGRELTIYNTGAGEIDIPNASAGSTAGNKFNNSDYGGVVILMANSGCAVQYVYSTADNFWHETGKACDPVIQQQSTAVTVSVPINLKNTAVNGWVDSTGTGYFGGDTSGAYLSSAIGGFPSLGFGFGTNAAFTGYINEIGFNESTTQDRSLKIQDGHGSGSTHTIASFDAATLDTTFPNGNVISHARFIASSASGSPPMMDWKQAGQTEWQFYQSGSTNGLQLWNSTVGADITTWDSAGTLTHTKSALFTGSTTTNSFTNTPIGGGGSPDGTHIERFDDMLGEIPTTVTAGGSASVGDWTLYTSGTGAAVSDSYDATNGLGRPGQRLLAYSAGSTSGNYAAMAMSKSFYLPDGVSTIDFAVLWPTLSSTSIPSASPYVSQMGFDDGYAGVAPTNGCYFAYDAANQLTGGVNAGVVQALECWCSKAGTRTGYLINNTGNSDNSFPLGVGTVAAATWYRLKIVITGATPKAEFYRNGTKVCEIATNIPNTTVNQTQPAFSIITKQTSGTGARLMDIDWARVSVDLTSVRSP